MQPKPYSLTDTIDDLFIRFFKQHHYDMMLRFHGHISKNLIVLPFDVAKLAVTLGMWEHHNHKYAVHLPSLT